MLFRSSAMKNWKRLTRDGFDNDATRSGLGRAVTDTHCCAPSGSTHGRVIF